MSQFNARPRSDGTCESRPIARLMRGFCALIAALGLVTSAACAPLFRMPPVPQSQQSDISVLGLNDAWYWGDEVTPRMIADGLASYRRERDYATAHGHPGPLPPAYYLAISGGGKTARLGPVSWSGGLQSAHDRPSSS